MGKGRSEQLILSPAIPLVSLNGTHPRGGVPCTPRSPWWDSDSDHVMEAESNEGKLFFTLLCHREDFGLPEPTQGLGKAKTGPPPPLSRSGRISPVFCSPFYGEHTHGSNRAPAQLSPVWGPPAVLGPSSPPWVGALELIAHSHHQETRVCAAGGAFCGN